MFDTVDVNNVCDVIDDAKHRRSTLIIFKGWRLIKDTCSNKNITFPSEFLRAETWKEDTINQKDYYFGGADCNFWSDIFLKARGNINIDIAQPEELILLNNLEIVILHLK